MSASPLPPIELEIINDIPIGKGLGSSAAALTAGVVIAAETLRLGWSRAKVLDEAARIEGHPDNVAACVLGSIVASALDGEGIARAVRMEIDSHYGVAVVVPDFLLPTVEARRVLPDVLFPRRRRVQCSAQRPSDRRINQRNNQCISRGARRPPPPALSIRPCPRPGRSDPPSAPPVCLVAPSAARARQSSSSTNVPTRKFASVSAKSS